jgi:peptidoglycan/xylan/chitin deacetylase (PgdA/CDA1 family)
MPTLMLMYHDLSDNPAGITPEHRPYVLDTPAFCRQMEAVMASGLPVLTVAQWGTRCHPEGALVLTFDDGHVSNHDIALPLLYERRLTATFFITVGLIGTGATMDWQQIRALHAAGMEIGSHTLTHRPPSTLNDAELRHELLASKRILEDGLGTPVTSISSPTGFFNPRMSVIAQEVGYRALCYGQAGLVADAGQPFALNRVAVKYTMQQDEFEALLRFESRLLRRLRRQQRVRDMARKTLGVNAYLRLRRMLTTGGSGR